MDGTTQSLADALQFLLVRNHPVDLRGIGFADQRTAGQMAFALGSFRSKNVTLEGVPAFDLAGGCLFESFGSTFVSL